ncbi:hypothetical protein ILUMI_19299 [Ignelater luminosus]|uniref:Uncharacterized protein n=1 Tax=Ignelater luminosus TaxID=2038154 RepID=A0A8K0G5L4_IGNLU|nr:hypothetical protein ILUMI_19299 [Ignelater luminosus]
MLFDDRDHIRKLALQRIIKLREAESSTRRRIFKPPNIDFSARDYTEIIVWHECQVTPPPVASIGPGKPTLRIGTALRAHILTSLVLVAILLDEVHLIEENKAETENMLSESKRSLITFATGNETCQILKAKYKIAMGKLEGNGSTSSIFSYEAVHPGREDG